MFSALSKKLAGLVAAGLIVASSSSCSSDPEPEEAPPAKFKADVLPILRTSCALTACHGSASSNLGIHLPEDAALVYKELQKVSPTANGVKFVVPGDPENSYFMLKIDGTQGKVGAKCANGTCGDQMPPRPDPLLSARRRDVVRRWIAAGAKDD
ncbi:MAG: hypothetical protein KF819_14290 [Labilithrix sp.]|nr:hypothetical protein [Labilithrix sp.]